MNISEPEFSIVIPVYNRADRIRPAIDSVIGQTFIDWEILVVDDGSRDGDALRTVVESYGDERIMYLRRANGGGSAARNTGIMASQGKYIALLDSDDEFLPEKLSTVKQEIDSHNNEELFIYSQMFVDRGVGRRWIKPAAGPKAGQRVDEYIMCTTGWIQTSTMVLSRGLAQRIKFDERLPSSQDTDFAIRCANACSNYYFIPKPLTILNDQYDPTRVSKQKNLAPLLEWIERMKDVEISERSYWAYRGWQCARIASFSSRWRALKLYIPSMIRGVYDLKTAARIFAQISIPQIWYQRIATAVIKCGGK